MLERLRTSFVYQVLYASINEYNVGRVSRMSAAVAYRALFALAPVFIISVGILGLVLGSDLEAQQEIYEGIETVLGSDVADALQTFLGTALAGSSSATIVGFVLLLWTSSSLFYEVQNDLNDIFHVPYEETAGALEFLKKRGWGFLWAVGLGLTVLAVWMVNIFWQYLEGFFEDRGLIALHQVLDALTPIVTMIFLPVLFALLFQTLTDVKVPRRALIRGSVYVAVAFVLAGLGAELYFAWSEDTSAATVAGSLFVIIFLAYVLSGVFLFGGVVTKVYSDFLTHGDVRAPTERKQTLLDESLAVDLVVAEPPTPLPVGAVTGFLAGLFVGWRRSRD